MTFDGIVSAIAEERGRQDAKWGRGFKGRSDTFWLAILAEEFGETANAILEHDEENITTELIQVAAVVFSWLEFRTATAEQYAQGVILYGERGEEATTDV